jgi:hypothetical protein
LNNSVDCFPLPLCLSTRLFMCGSLLFTMFLTSPNGSKTAIVKIN